MSEIKETIKHLRSRLIEYRLYKGNNISIHINAIEIAICLVEYLMYDPTKKLTKDERRWFEAGYEIDMILQNSEWSDIADKYYQLVDFIKNK